MFQSLIRGFKMILASIELGLNDPKILVPSFLMVLMNFFYTDLLLLVFKSKAITGIANSNLTNNIAIHKLSPGNFHHSPTLNMVSHTATSGAFDHMNTDFINQYFNPSDLLTYFAIIIAWWLTNIIFEGITTALVYTNLTDGPNKGNFWLALKGVVQSLPDLILLGLATVIAKKLVGWIRHHRSTGVFGFGVDFIAGIVEIFWTMAGHLILPAIIIEGNSFFQAIKRADQIAQGNIITIGFGEVEVEGLCKIMNFGVFLVACVSAFSAYLNHPQIQSAAFIGSVLLWASLVVGSAALTIYLRSAFYACLYVWAIDAEQEEPDNRSSIRPPMPLAQAIS